MPKFSIIIPVYNVEKYIQKCLDSVINQTFKDYEIIVVNDGTKDNSMDIVNKYNVRIINQKNQGQSAARNAGVKIAKGEYLIFLDSDDYWKKDLLENINRSLIRNNPDVVRFQMQEVYEQSDNILEHNEKAFEGLTGVAAFNAICKYYIVDAACPYAIKKEYYLKNKFAFKEGMVHEDYGLIPLIIIKAQVVNSISYVGYCYLQREESTMNTKDYSKTKKKVSDMYQHYKYLITEIDKTNLDSKIFKSFISNSMILKICSLKGNDYKYYKKELRKEKVFDNILTDTLTRKIKKFLLKISPKIYYKTIGK